MLVSGLPPTGSWQDVKDHMREAGEVIYADVFRDGTGVVEFSHKDDMEWAVKNLDDSKFKSHEVNYKCILYTDYYFIILLLFDFSFRCTYKLYSTSKNINVCKVYYYCLIYLLLL